MACYFVVAKGDNKVLDIGDSVLYSIHGSHKIAHVYHPVINGYVLGFCWWDVSKYDIHCEENIYYHDVLEKYKIRGDEGGDEDNMKYINRIQMAALKYSRDRGLYL